jgi:hypothetical protein
MPFQQYATHFGPEELETLTAAFDASLLELRAAGVDMSTEQKLALVKKRLAQRLWCLQRQVAFGTWKP